MPLNQMGLGLMEMEMEVGLAMSHLRPRMIDLHFCNLHYCDLGSILILAHRRPCHATGPVLSWWQPCSKPFQNSKLRRGRRIGTFLHRRLVEWDEASAVLDEASVLDEA